MPHYLLEGTHENAGPDRLIKATNKAQAIAHAAKQDYRIKVATVEDVLAAMKDGVITKRLENNRAIYSLPAEDDGKPVQRVVEEPSVKPSAASVASATPFSHRAAFPNFAPTEPAVEIPRFVPDAPAPTRFGVFSDGTLVIEAGMARIELDAATAKRLLELARAVVA